MTTKNDLMNVGGIPATTADLMAGFQNMLQVVPQAMTMPLLRMQTDGMFVYGQENIEVEDGSLWAINPLTLEHGFCCWTNYDDKDKKNELLGEFMVPFTKPTPSQADLPDHGWPWKSQVAMQLRCMNGEDEGTHVMYKGSSVGLCNAVRDLVEALMEQIAKDPKNMVPVVALDSDHYTHKKYGKIYTPLLDIKRWVPMDSGIANDADEGDAAGTEGDNPSKSEAKTEQPSQDEKPAASRGRRNRGAQAEKDDAPAPRQRRRARG